MWGASNVLTIASFSHDYITSSVLQMVKNVNFLDWLIDETHVLLVLCALANAQIRILKYKSRFVYHLKRKRLLRKLVE